MAGKVKVIKDTSLIPMDVSGTSLVHSKSDDCSKDSFLAARLDNEIKRSISVDESLQEQIDTIKKSGFAVVDVVTSYEDLMNYDTHSLIDKDIIVVLYDENGREVGDRSTYYRWDGTSFSPIGSSNYTIDEIDRIKSDLESQISYLGSKSSLRDVVLRYGNLDGYDTSHLVNGDIIVVLEDENYYDGSTTCYKYLDNGQQFPSNFEFCGGLGPIYYSKKQIDEKLGLINTHLSEIDSTLEKHGVRITQNRSELDHRISYEDALDILEKDQNAKFIDGFRR